jgi:cyclopropane fatty-acyl-phospholipid synthase-like methyltransferase
MTLRTCALLLPLIAIACTPATPAAPAAAPPAAEHAHHGHGPLVHRFQSAAEWAKDFDDPARDAWQQPAVVVAALHLAPGQRVADLGAGTGYFLPHLSRAVGPSGKVLGLDIEADMVRYMTERAAREGLANVEARKVPLDDPGLAAGSVDRVLIVDTWHHIDGRAAYAARLRAALAPGGAVFVVDFKQDAHRGPPREHRIKPEQVVEELAQGGLAASITDVALPEQYVVVGRAP